MYKVFVNDTPIILTDSIPKENKYPVYLFEYLIVGDVLGKLTSNSISGVLVLCVDLEASKAAFFENFKIVTAAGGLVVNRNKEILFIYRSNTWDLPKGGIEDGETLEETALREVTEECGIEALRMDQFLVTTYHYYYHKKNTIKVCHWFLMKSDYDGPLVPQEEEGITEVVFKDEDATLDALKNSYANINLVYEKYRDLQGFK